MLRPFGGTTLTDVVLGKLAALATMGHATFFAGYEDEFATKCREHGVRFVRRDPRSIAIDGPIVEILSFLCQVEADWVLLVSSCLPFLRLETIVRFLEECRRRPLEPAMSVRSRHKHFLTRQRTAINFDLGAKTLNTKKVEPIWELVDALYFFDRRYFLAEGRYWDWQAVRFVELEGERELLDVDTEEDFALAEAVWRHGGGQAMAAELARPGA